jgi:glutathione S-transferase
MQDMRVFGDLGSGNCYKIKLLASYLELDHEWVYVDIMSDTTRTDAFLAMNPNGKVPVLELDDGRCLSESNAILDYLADGTPYLPNERYARAQVLQWQFFEQYSHEPYIAVARFINEYLGLPEARRAEYESKKPGGYKALAVMEGQLQHTKFLVGGAPTVADISLYAYTHVAHEGGFSLEAYPAVRRWLSDLERHPRHVTMAEAIALSQGR